MNNELLAVITCRHKIVEAVENQDEAVEQAKREFLEANPHLQQAIDEADAAHDAAIKHLNDTYRISLLETVPDLFTDNPSDFKRGDEVVIDRARLEGELKIGIKTISGAIGRGGVNASYLKFERRTE